MIWLPFEIDQLSPKGHLHFALIFVVVQSLSCVWLFVTPWTATRQASLSITISQSLLTFRSFESVMLSNHLILCCPFLLPSVFPSIRVFSNKSALHSRWPKYWSVSFSISHSTEYSGLISLRLNWFDDLLLYTETKNYLQKGAQNILVHTSDFFLRKKSCTYSHC